MPPSQHDPPVAGKGDSPTVDLPAGVAPTVDLRMDLRIDSAVIGRSLVGDGGAPSQFGEYGILSEIARGGMGVVYRARQKRLNRTVALKMILAGQLASDADIKRFYAEAEAAAALAHSGIVPIFEVGQHGSQHFFSMAFVDGQSLQERLKLGPLPPRTAAELLAAVADAVSFAHSKGIVHRDLKPHNILLDAEGKPQVTDFGLAKRLDRGEGLTNTGDVLGTPAYMAPEQAAGKAHEVDALADVYALGAVLYATLTGRPPFQAASLAELLQQVIGQEPVSPKLLNQATPQDLDTICLKCLHKDPQRRYTSAAALHADLQRFLRGEPITARPVSTLERGWRWCRRNPAVSFLIGTVASLLVIVAVAATLVAFRMSTLATNESQAKQVALRKTTEAETAKSRETTAKNLAQATSQELRTNLSQQYVAKGAVALEERDFGLALVWFVQALELDKDQPERAAAHRMRIGNTYRQMPRLTGLLFHAAPIAAVTFSPDGKYVATASYDKTAQIWNATSGEPFGPPLQHDDYVYDVAFSPDNELLATGSCDGTARVWNVSTSEPFCPPLKHARSVNDVSFSADGQFLLTACADRDSLHAPPAGVQARKFQNRDTSLPLALVWNRQTGETVRLKIANADQPISATFSQDQKLIATGGWNSAAHVWTAETGEQVHGPFKHEAIIDQVSFSGDNRWLVTRDVRTHTRVWKLADGSLAGPQIADASPHIRVLDDTQIQIGNATWNFVTGKRVSEISRDIVAVQAMGPSGSNEVLASTKSGLQLMHTTKGTPLSGPMPTISREAALSPDRRRVVAINADARQCTAYLWDRAGDSSPLPPLGHTVASVAYSSDGSRLLTGSLWYGTVRTWNTSTGQAMSPPISHPPGCLAGFNPDDSEVVTIGSDRTVRRHDAVTGVQRGGNLESGCESPRSVKWSYSLDGQRLVLISLSPSETNTTTVQGWDLKTDKPLWEPFSSGYRGMHLTMNPRTDVFAIAGSSGYARLHDSLTGEPRSAELKHDYFLNMPAFSADGQLLATPSADKVVRLWDVATGELRGQLVHDEVVNVVAFTPDGKLLVSGSKLGARVWDVATQQPVGPVIQPGHDINALKISPDGRFVLLAHGHDLRIWEINTGEPAGPPLPFGTVAADPKFHPHGTQIAYTAGDATGAISLFTPDERSLEQLQQCTDLLLGRRLDSWGTLQSIPRAELLAIWEQYTSRYADERSVPTQQARAWHRRLAARAQFEVESAAALVVLKQCFDETPEDLTVRSMLAESAARMNERELAVDALLPVVGAGQASLLDWYFLEAAYPDDLKIRWKKDLLATADKMKANPGSPHWVQLQAWLASKRDLNLGLEGFDLAIGNGARGKVLSQRARVLSHLKRWPEAREALTKALEFDRSEQDIWQSLIYVNLILEDEEAAKAAMIRYTDQFAYSTDVLALNWLAWLDALYMHRDPEKAKQRALRSVQSLPRRDSFCTALAAAQLRCGEFERAKENLEIARAAAGGKYNGLELLLLALIQHHMKQPEEARASLKLAREWREAKPQGRTWQQQIDFAHLLKEAEPLVEAKAEGKPNDEVE